jgi:dihydrofolate reductase
MRRVRYQVAASLDGYIAGPNGEYDWIPDEPTYDFAKFYSEIDTVLMGRKTFEPLPEGGAGFLSGMEIVVFSTTLDPASAPDVAVVSDAAVAFVADLKNRPGKDIWLFGGGILFRSLLEAGLVDTVEVAVMPVLLGQGIRLLPEGAAGATLRKVRAEEYPAATVLITYEVDQSRRPGAAEG